MYHFDRVLILPVEALLDGRHFELQAGDLALSTTAAAAGWRLPLGEARPA